MSVIVEKGGAGKPEIDVEKYTSNPGGKTPFKPVKFIDVKLNDSSNLDYIFLKVYYTDSEISGLNESSLKLYWWNGSEWIQCSDTGVNETGNYVWANITSTSIPTLSQLTGTVFSPGEPKPPKPKPQIKIKTYKPTILNVNYTVVNNTAIFNITASTEDGKPLNGTIELWAWKKIDTSLGKMYVFTYTEKYSVVNGIIAIEYPLHSGLNGFLIEFIPENPDYAPLFYKGGREPIWIEI